MSNQLIYLLIGVGLLYIAPMLFVYWLFYHSYVDGRGKKFVDYVGETLEDAFFLYSIDGKKLADATIYTPVVNLITMVILIKALLFAKKK